MGGLPGPRWAAPSYFLAVSFRYQANGVPGVTMVPPPQEASVLTLWTWRLIAGFGQRSTAAADTEQAAVALLESQRLHRRVRAERRLFEAIHLAVSPMLRLARNGLRGRIIILGTI